MTKVAYLDTAGIWDATVSAPEQALSAVADASDVLDSAVLPEPDDIRSVVVFGMGTSSTAAELVAAFGAANASVPIVACNGYALPSFVGPDTLALRALVRWGYRGDVHHRHRSG